MRHIGNLAPDFGGCLFAEHAVLVRLDAGDEARVTQIYALGEVVSYSIETREGFETYFTIGKSECLIQVEGAHVDARRVPKIKVTL